MRSRSLIKFLSILSVLIFSGCPNTMIGLGDKVDIDTPSVSIGKYGDGSPIVNGDYVKGEVILTGSASDDIGIQSVKLSFDGGLTFSNAAVSSNQLAWSYTVDTAVFEDGEKDIIVLVSDTSASPKTSEERLLLYFDNTAPLVVVNSPAGYASTDFTDLIISLKGEATDPFRIRKIDVELTGGSGTLGTVEGTNSWTCAFTSTGTGNYSFKITAEDYAGNRSTHFYHYDDILVANGSTFITTEDVYKVENGVDVLNLTGAELTAIELNDLPISVSMDLDNPVITISNPDPDALIINNVLPGNAKFIGSASDDDGINITTSPMQISIDNGPWDNISVSGSGLFVTWEYSKSFVSSADHSLRIKATDIYGVETISNPANFRIDVDAAIVDITSPTMSEYKNVSDFSITGNASSSGGDITNIDISLDNGSSWNPVTPGTALPVTPVTWTYNATGVSDGILAIKARASDDNASTWTYTNLQITVDTQDPISGFTTPTFSSYVNGSVDIRGTSSDNNLLDKVEIKIGDDDTRVEDNGPWILIPDADKYNWTHTIDSLLYENSTDGIETSVGSGIFRLNVYTRATDVAGNVYETASGDHYFYIDNALDSPTVIMVSPQADASLGGSLIVSGTAADDDGAVQAVYMQIDVNTAPGGTPNFSDTVTLSSPIDFDGPGGNPGITNIDESQFYCVSGTSLWSVEMNTAGELYDTDGAGPHTGDIHIRVKSKDINGLMGDYVELHFAFDDSIPLISNLLPASDAYVNGVFSITGDVHDETQIKHLEISYDGGTTYHYIIQNNIIQAPYGSGSVTTDYSLNVSVDTSDIPDVGAVTSSDITIRLKVTDNTNYQSQASLTYYVDNNLPSGWMSQDTTDMYGSGDNAIFSGYADDTGVVSGVDKIIAYFEKGGNFYNPRDGSSTPSTNVDADGLPSDTNFQVVIDSTIETLSGANPDGDGIAEELNVGTFYEWKFQIESSFIPDGESTLHYVVYDKSGNMFHNTKTIFIKNDKPVINSMKVGYDLDGNTTVEGDEIFTYAGQFKARDYLYFEFLASDLGGISTYKVYEGTDATGNNVLSAISGQIDISGKTEGIQTYFCQVTDGDDITDEVIISVDIDNVDDVAPVFTLDILDQSSVTAGHLETAGSSLYDNGTGADADVSGTIKFTGTASDDQGIKEIRLLLDGTLHILANWSGGLFESREPANFTINTQTIDPVAGHQITWTYTWNTATVTNIAGNNISASFTVDDFGTGPNQDTGNITVDVVPYISKISTSVTTAFSDAFSRSSSGKYPVRINSTDSTFETVTVSGYNLNPSKTTDADSDVRISLDPDALNPGKVGKGLSYGNIAADYTSLDVSMEVNGVGSLSGSGYLTVFTNGIPSINNINSNTGNSEADYINPNLTDDRFLSVWDLRLLRNDFTLANNAVYPSMSMNGDNPEFSYDNNSQGWGIALYLDGTTEKKVYENWDLFTFSAIDHNSNGNHSAIYDINVVNGNNGDANSGNYGGILANFFYDVPATSWNYWSYRFNDNQLWLENLVDEDATQDGNGDLLTGTAAVLNRYQFPDIYTVGTTSDTSVFYSVYDSLKDKIIFRTFKVGTDTTIGDSSGGRINDSGTALYTSIPQYDQDGVFPIYDGDDRRFYNSAESGKTPVGQHLIDDTNTGNYTAVTATADGSTAVVAYYDATGTGNVRLKYNNTPTNSANWVDLGIIDSGHGGENIDLKIDTNNNIHIAYYDNNKGDLRYLYLPKATADPTWVVGDIETYIVDNYFDVGEKLTLELDSTNHPFIAYKGVNRSGKVAWLTGTPSDGADSNEQFTGSWEIMILPTQITNTDSNKFCIGVDIHGLPVAGYTNGGIEYIRLLADLTD